MTVGIWVLGDQMDLGQAALASAEQGTSRVLLVESSSVLGRRAYHRQKLVLVWSAMRHFAAELREAGWTVDHRIATSFAEAVDRWIQEHGITELRVMEPADRGFRAAIEALQLAIPLVWLPSNAFLWSRDAFAAWAGRHKQLRLEFFYREGRRRFGVLMEGTGKSAQPLGGQWNFDQ
ncbi:MAG: cryptochrome/photolyase family protein, partial [Synechococcaceae bacterium WB4_1_0192]|nr:cryptochrome/photolyase family protein [Synechococcaceae bacterium WB4_1_0192]